MEDKEWEPSLKIYDELADIERDVMDVDCNNNIEYESYTQVSYWYKAIVEEIKELIAEKHHEIKYLREQLRKGDYSSVKKFRQAHSVTFLGWYSVNDIEFKASELIPVPDEPFEVVGGKIISVGHDNKVGELNK